MWRSAASPLVPGLGHAHHPRGTTTSHTHTTGALAAGVSERSAQRNSTSAFAPPKKGAGITRRRRAPWKEGGVAAWLGGRARGRAARCCTAALSSALLTRARYDLHCSVSDCRY
jgi:hypothetical protein